MTAGETRFAQTSSLRKALGFKPTTPPVLRTAEVKRWLIAIRNDPWYEIDPVPYASRAFLDICGLSKQAVGFGTHGVTQGGSKIGSKVIASLTPIMDMIEGGELVFVSAGPNRPWAAIKLPKPARPSRPQSRLLERADYNWWGRCISCLGRRYAMVSIHGQHHAACWHCLPPAQYRQVAAEPTGLRLIARWVPPEYRAT